MPRNSKKIIPFALLAAASIFLAGCSTSESPRASQETATPPATTTATSTPTPSQDDALAEALMGEMGVTVLEVVDPRTFRVEPDPNEQETNGLSGEATITMRESSDIVTPLEGECGYTEALAFAKQYFTDNPENAYVLEGNFETDEYYDAAIESGFAFFDYDTEAQYAGAQDLWLAAQEEAKAAGTGLYALCSDFGA